MEHSLRSIPQVAKLLDSEIFAPLLAAHGRVRVLLELRAHLDDLRHEMLTSMLASDELDAATITQRVAARLSGAARPYYRRVINATGVVLHTNLGRAPLAPEAVEALVATASGAQRLEVDLETGERGGRDRGCAQLLCELTGAEAATVVNNNAAATLLLLAALARGKKVLVSRGELVEIGGSYRIPEILAESGARLVEVGTTNRTHLKDYQNALDGDTGLILKVHTSNYRVVGFTAEVEIEALCALGREHGVPVAHDLGSGALLDLAPLGLGAEPLVSRSVSAGCDLVCFSGDKLLGGPQAGILVGKRTAIEACRRQPLFRALRPGRLVYTALEATLRLYGNGPEEALRRVPVLSLLALTPAQLESRARAFVAELSTLERLRAEVVPLASQAGSGALPAVDIPSFGLELRVEGASAQDLAAALRLGDTAVLVRVKDEALVIDLRTVFPHEEAALGAAIRRLFTC